MKQQLKQLSGDTAIYGVTTIVQRFLSFLLTPLYTHFLVPEEFGVQTYIFVLIAFLMVVANAGMESSFFKYDSVAKGDEEKRKVFWNAITVNWIVAAVIGGAFVLAPTVLGDSSFLGIPAEYLYLVRLAGVIIFLDSASMISLGLLRMRRKAKVFGGIKIAAICVNIGLNIWLVAVLDMKLEGIFISGVVQSLVQFGLTLPFVARMFPVRLSANLRKQMLRFGLPTVMSGIAMIALQLVDRPIMEYLKGLDGLGMYQANYRLGIAMMLLVSMFEFAWKPFFLQQAGSDNAPRVYARVFTYFNIVAGFVFLAVSFFIVDIAAIPVPFTNGKTIIAPVYWQGLTIVPIILLAYIFNGWYVNFVVGVYIKKKTKGLAWITALGAVMEAALCFLLIPLFGIAGGGWATCGAYGVMAIALYYYIRKQYPIPYEWLRVAKASIGVIAIWGANTLLLDFYDHSFNAALIRAGLLVAFPVWLVVTGFFNAGERRELRQLLVRGRRGA